MHDEIRPHWRKSSYSANDSDCVELAWSGTRAGIRDSKAPDAGELAIPAAAFTTLLSRTKQS